MGGALGISAVLVELPISTTIMLRAIARIAQSEGEDLRDPETALACRQVDPHPREEPSKALYVTVESPRI